ncbi:mitochondrial inner membrane protein required for protein import [Cladophialophora chaetospira]|uniref:Mitochondrial import inner membrane translocase subunit TIM50 n=1 Tax=Cladophialophora chaetospira TaxID=386627 RepID=A0AA38XGA7_9EURO|nr:mitochondrial inner membrane protein required for protein import [Cladophialophora chaetospira]
MLRRSASLLRPGRIRPSISQAQLQTQLRYFAKDRRDGDYKAPGTLKQSSPQKQPLRKVPFVQTTPAPKVESSSPSKPFPSSATHFQQGPRPNTTPFGQDPSKDLDDVSESVAQASRQSVGQEQQRIQELENEAVASERTAAGQEPAQASEPEETQPPQQPLPDLTKGIPSTLDAELKAAQSQHAARHSSSLNITEDPAEELPAGARGREGGDVPKEEYVSSSDRKKENIFRYVYLTLGLGAVGGSIYLGRNWTDEEEAKKHSDAPSGWGFMLFYNRVTARLGDMMSYYRDPVTTKLLPDEDPDPNFRFPFVLVLSLEDMLVHSEWTRDKGWRIAKRPGVDYFLRYLSAYYEIVLFTSQPSAVVDQVIRKLDPFSMIRWPLFREATLYKDGGYIKDLAYLNRDLKKVIMIDTVPHHVKHQPENAVILPKWNGDPNDQTLVQFIPFLEYLATMGFEDTREVLKSFEGTYIPAEFARREKLLRAKFQEEQAAKGGKRPKKRLGLSSVLGVSGRNPDGLDTSDDSKMLWDQIRERGQKQYMELEKKIQEEGAKFLADREAEEKKYQEEMYKSMKPTGWFSGLMGGGQEKPETK